MGNRQGEGVGGVRWRRRSKAKDDFHHLGYLCLVGPSCPCDRPLHPRRRILRNLESRPRTYEEGDTPRVTELAGGLRILREEQPLYARVRRTIVRHDADEFALDDDESIGERRRQIRVDDAVSDVLETRPLAPDNPPTEVSRAGVEPENDDHASLLTPLGHLLVRDVKVSIDVLYVVVVVERLRQVQRDLGIATRQRLLGLWQVRHR